MIHRDLAIGAEAMNRTLQAAPAALPDLAVALGVGLALAHRELLMHLWTLEDG